MWSLMLCGALADDITAVANDILSQGEAAGELRVRFMATLLGVFQKKTEERKKERREKARSSCSSRT